MIYKIKLSLINSIEWSKKYSLENLHEDQVSSEMQKTYHSSVDISVLKNLDIMIDLVDLEPPSPKWSTWVHLSRWKDREES